MENYRISPWNFAHLEYNVKRFSLVEKFTFFPGAKLEISYFTEKPLDRDRYHESTAQLF